MTTLTLRLSDAQKRAIKTKAALSGKSMKDLILEGLGIQTQSVSKPKCGLEEAIDDMKNGRYETFDTFEEWKADSDKIWKEALNES